MASKSSVQRSSDAESEQEGSKSWSPPPPPQRPRRMKTTPRRFHYGVDRSIRGVSENIPETSPNSRGTSAADPSESPSKKRKGATSETVLEKGKKKAAGPSKPPKSKKPKTASGTQEKGQSSSKTTSAQPMEEPSVIHNAIQEIYDHSSPPNGFASTNSILSNDLAAKFKDSFLKKEFCPSVSVDLNKLKEECNLDLTPWLKEYESFLSITASYTPNIVKLFYFNMIYDNILDSEGELVEERVSTSVKGVTFTFSATTINTILKITNPPPVPSIQYSNEEIFTILRPNEPFPDDQRFTLSFKPVSMPPIHRALWYIYSRNFIQKGGNYTHFTQKDYPLFAALVNKVPLNIGHWIFQEMVKFKFASRRPSHIPFPSLVSVILFYHKIWYLGTPDTIKTPPMFGKSQLNYMKITFEGTGSGQSRAPSRSRASHARASQAHAQEAQSAPPSSDFDARIKGIIDAAIAAMSIRIEFEVGKLVAEVTRGNHEMVDAQEEMKESIVNISEQTAKTKEQVDTLIGHMMDHDAKLASLLVSTAISDDKLDKIIKLLQPASTSASGSGLRSSNPDHTPHNDPSSSSPSFTFTVPQAPMTSPAASTPMVTISPHSTSTPTTEILATTSPITPTTEIVFPSQTPTTEILPQSHNLDSPPSTPLIDPLHEPSISAPSLFDDDKGGENTTD